MDLENMKPNVIVICGPTALGKTAVAIELAAVFNGEIVGADSMQIYRYMDIGTAKPSSSEQFRVTHHMIDIVDPDQHFNAQKYAQMAREKIMELASQDSVPFVVGGTGLYIKALVHGLFKAGPANHDVRRRLQEKQKSTVSNFFTNGWVAGILTLLKEYIPLILTGLLEPLKYAK